MMIVICVLLHLAAIDIDIIDIDIIDMTLYDSYRQIDGEPHSHEHLLESRMKLMQKVKRYKEQINHL